MKVNLKKVMKKAHELAKKMVGDYAARLALALRQAWKEVRNVVLPEMKGSQKQIAWAEDIRSRVIPVVEKAINYFYEAVETKEFYQSRSEEFRMRRKEEGTKALETLKAIDSAKEWIDRFGYKNDEEEIVSFFCYIAQEYFDISSRVCTAIRKEFTARACE
ncbi:hypothetical protein [Aneurinibacillus thermoaerophilus]|uniref:Uncharacterized protein n=1 Tax=Aneurinibacillus thermoaerophilus TaxID=143495 RepID=A0A1G8FQL9_ANETH|nr:hypothetical protein [Aneurinibacillus thermoaerophilus]MED0737839.1 hypothetical protein [Aneurinibacillus thermoaerophilus]SDH84473.1 hypothetical protein SAMN04489735_10783 [Aneurinibacillus thermoaerophilus]